MDGTGGHDTETSLTAVAWRENGTVYYAPTVILNSAAYRWLLKNKPGLEDFYARIPLLITPTKRWHHWREDVELEIRPEVDCLNTAGHDEVNGLFEPLSWKLPLIAAQIILAVGFLAVFPKD